MANTTFNLDERPVGDYGLPEFDRRLQVLDHIPDRDTRREILERLEDVDVNIEELGSEFDLPRGIRDGLQKLVDFFNTGAIVSRFGGVVVAEINVAAPQGHVDISTYVLAVREEKRIHFVSEDENGDGQDLGWADRAISMREMVALVDIVLRDGAPGDRDWRDVVLGTDRNAVVWVGSGWYPGIGKWYRHQVRDWLGRHPVDSEAGPGTDGRAAEAPR